VIWKASKKIDFPTPFYLTNFFFSSLLKRKGTEQFFFIIPKREGIKMRNKGLGFICIGHRGWIFFLDKNTRKINPVKSLNKGEYLPKRVNRLKEKFPLNQKIRTELIARIRNNDY
jgi:hypothetical protein